MAVIDSIQLDELSVSGISRGGVETWFRVRPPDAAFDVGRGAPELSGVEQVFLTHGHLDHVAGVPFLLSQRALQQLGGTSIYCPHGIVERLEAYIDAAASLEEKSYEYELCALRPGDRVAVGEGLWVEAFATDHVVPSLGYHLIRKVERLHEEFTSKTGAELAEMRRSGIAIEKEEERLWLCYPGDTAAGIFESEPRLYDARILLIECTFLHSKWRDRAASYGHIHFQDLKERQHLFANERIVLHHQSRRFSSAELRRAVEGEMPGLAGRVRILGESRDMDD